MIPILYESTETAFASNGLGRLRDCISCTVTEERNGIYECDFEYPVSGSNFDEITLGRIVGVTHDESDDIQPFDIVSYTRPINGVVTFHCVHISYRQSFMTVTGSSINSLADAFTLFGTAEPSNPFSYSTDITSSAYFAAADGLPHSVRQMLGGMEGSILDAYGGEYEWDKFNVILHSARGQARSFDIRYGVNMVDFNDEMDSSSTYSSCVPYWTDGTNTVIGDVVSSSSDTITGRDECIPLDLSDKFESEPTKAQVEAMASTYLSSNNPHSPQQTISVEFVRLQDMGFTQFANLLECKLCDTINVIFPTYNMSSRFKIVKTVWDVLRDRYDSMELGNLSTSLAEALGIQETSAGGINLLSVYPIGSIYMSTNSTSPATLFGGTWTQLQDRFLLGAGSTYTAGDTGGSANAIIPYHRHSVDSVSISASGAHSHDAGSKQAFLRYNQGAVSTGVQERSVASASGNYKAPVVNNANVDWSYVSSTSSETHTHTVPSHNTNYAGTSGNTTGANMPPYLVVYMWQRTA